jgi:hypothetical protein
VNELTYFTVEGHWYDVEAPDTSGSTNALQFLVISAFVTFTPRLEPGFSLFIPNLDLQAQLVAPSSLAVAPSTTGGTLAAGATYWVVTATTANGETTVSNEVTATLTGSTSSAVLSWSAVVGATGYNVYRGTTAGGENKLVASVSTNTYTDTGAASTTVSPPSTNTAEISANTGLAIAPVTARILEGELQTIDRTDVAELQLLANDTNVSASLTAQGVANGALIYDVSFSNVVYASAGQTLQNFAFTAPTSATTVDLTDPTMTRLAYDPSGY